MPLFEVLKQMELFEKIKNYPILLTCILVACLVIAIFGFETFTIISEQRDALSKEKDAISKDKDALSKEKDSLLNARLQQLELDNGKQKKINTVILSQIASLRSGYQNLPVSLMQVKNEFESVIALNVLDNLKTEQVKGLINNLSLDVTRAESALNATDMLVKTFDEFLSGVEAEQLGSYKKAVSQYRKAASKGNVEAQYRLGVLYARGAGVSQNFSEAAKWYERASRGGNITARTELAQLYLIDNININVNFSQYRSMLFGVSVNHNKLKQVEALALYKSLENLTPLITEEKITELSKELSPSELYLANIRAREIIEKDNVRLSNSIQSNQRIHLSNDNLQQLSNDKIQ